MGRRRRPGVSRRTFLRWSAASVALLGLPVGCRAPREAAADASFPLEEITLDDLRAGMAAGRWSSREITRMYLDRIDRVDRAGPTLRSVIETNPDALAVADALDDERRRGRVRGPLHGVPVLVKDNVATADRMTTTAGSLALEGAIAPRDSFVAHRLREGGAVLLGKANLSEWANFRSTRSSSGWSARGGQCRNPYALDRNPCGSSSGSAVAVAANLAPVAIGTETNGSIVCPASANGIVGVKPTVGLVGRTGIIPISPSQDTAGPMARSVRDAAVLLDAIAGVDPEDPAAPRAAGAVAAGHAAGLDEGALRGARIGVARQFFGFHDGVDARMEEALAVLRDEGAVLVDPVRIERVGEAAALSYEVLLYEFRAAIADYLEWLGEAAPFRGLDELVAFNEAHASREMPYFGQEVFLAALEKGPLSDPEYLEARESSRRWMGDEGIDAVTEAHGLDAIVAPTGGPAWVTDLVNGDHYGGGSSTPAAVAGYPNVTVPAGEVHGLPVGLSFFGRAWSEPRLLALAHAFERATGFRRPPRLLPALDAHAGTG